MATDDLYRVSKAGATVREGVELSSPKLDRVVGRSVVGVVQTKTTADGVCRARLDDRCGRLAGGWVSRWVLKRVGGDDVDETAPPPPAPVVAAAPAEPWTLAKDGKCEAGGLRFSGDFCSGNLAGARVGADGVVEVAARRDNQGAAWESRHSAWLYFRVEDARPPGSGPVVLRVRSAARQGALYRHGYRPVERDGARRRADHGDWAALSGDAGWRRVDAARFRYVEIPDAPSDDDDDPTTVHCVVEGDVDAAGAAWVAKQKEKKKTKKKRDPDAPRSLLEWDAVFPASRALEFAFCYPYGVAEITATLDALENAYADDDEILFRRERLTTSLEHRPVDLITITARQGSNDSKERPLEWAAPAKSGEMARAGGSAWVVDAVPGDSSDGSGGSDDEAPEAKKPSLAAAPALTPARTSSEGGELAPGRREVVVSARVHPGETPAQFVVDGLLAALLQRGPVGAALREAYVWRVVPCLNPDGVARGHYRKDARGDDQNRCYWPPPATQHLSHPAQAALLALGRAAGDRLRACVDVHAHANTRGCFVFGNHAPLGGDDAPELLACRLAAHSRHVEYGACDFSRRKMANSGAARVAMHHLGVADGRPRGAEPPAHAYTLECNYNSGTKPGKDASLEPPGAVRAAWAACSYLAPLLSAPYDPDAWRDVGRALAMALLDLAADDAARGLSVPTRGASALDEARAWLETRRSTELEKRKQRRPKKGLRKKKPAALREGN